MQTAKKIGLWPGSLHQVYLLKTKTRRKKLLLDVIQGKIVTHHKSAMNFEKLRWIANKNYIFWEYAHILPPILIWLVPLKCKLGLPFSKDIYFTIKIYPRTFSIKIRYTHVQKASFAWDILNISIKTNFLPVQILSKKIALSTGLSFQTPKMCHSRMLLTINSRISLQK